MNASSFLESVREIAPSLSQVERPEYVRGFYGLGTYVDNEFYFRMKELKLATSRVSILHLRFYDDQLAKTLPRLISSVAGRLKHGELLNKAYEEASTVVTTLDRAKEENQDKPEVFYERAAPQVRRFVKLMFDSGDLLASSKT